MKVKMTKRTNSSPPKYFYEKPVDLLKKWWLLTSKELRYLARQMELVLRRVAPDVVPVFSARAAAASSTVELVRAQPDQVQQQAPVLPDLVPQLAPVLLVRALVDLRRLELTLLAQVRVSY